MTFAEVAALLLGLVFAPGGVLKLVGRGPAMALGARVTDRLRFMTGVTNPATRHPAALATAIATVQEVSGGRAILGIGRGDTALFHLGRQPMAEQGHGKGITHGKGCRS